MSRTKRIYNSKHWQWHSEWSLKMRYTGWYNGLFVTRQNGWVYGGTFVYHPWKHACMGHCHSCRDARKDWRRKRHQLKNELRLELKRYGAVDLERIELPSVACKTTVLPLNDRPVP